jgi:hypothetical protein
MGAARAGRHALTMTIQPNTTQRDLVRLALLVCGERPGEKYRSPVKGGQGSSNADPSRGYAR